MKKYDKNNDGKMNFDEFEQFLIEFKSNNKEANRSAAIKGVQ